MASRPLPSLEQVRAVLDYEPESGAFTWRFRADATAKFNNRFAGKPAGTLCKHGYLHITINFRQFRANRLAWLLMTGAWPTFHVDHEDGVPSNNRWRNLREATNAQNAA